MDISDLGPTVQGYFQAGLAPATQASYRAALKKFHNFCTKYNIRYPFPVTEQLLCYFAAYIATQGLAPQTRKAYLSAVRSMQVSLGLPDPRDNSSLPILKRVQAGIRRTRALQGPPSQIRLPITPKVLEDQRCW